MSKVFLDYGHGGTDPGAGGSGLREKDLTLQIGLKVASILRKNKVTVVETRTSDKTVSLQRRAQLANASKADLFVSIHINSAGSAQANGVETFSYPGSANGAKLSKAIQDELVKSKLFKSNRGTKTANFYVIRYTNMPAALVELGFIKNSHDSSVMKNKQDELAQAVATGILSRLGKKVSTTAPTPSKPKPKPTPTPSKPSTSISGAKLVKNENAFFLVTASGIKVRSKPSTKANNTGTLKKGNSINYKRVFEGNGYRWLEYTGNSGNTLYVPYRESGSGKKNWGTFHSKRPSTTTAKPKPKKSIAQMAKEVHAGKHGTGHTNRRKSLGISQAEYEKVRKEVNRTSKTTSKTPSIKSLADRILHEKGAPTGHENRRKWLNIDQATYEKVRREVNRRS